MVINKREGRDMKRRRKEGNSTCHLLDDSPKRTKVHAQRKFAQGSNVSSPVITPVKEIDKQDKTKVDVFPEPQELLSINRPHTEDFLTFLCFRGTTMLPPTLNFFNAAPIDSNTHLQQTVDEEPTESCPPIANINPKTMASTSEKPFIAFGVRKRADPILVSKHMDKKRRHALALQALRRKYQEQKMAKIRAVTISKLSEKVSNKNLVRTRSITKNETATVKKTIPTKNKVKIVSSKHVKITRSSINPNLRTNLKAPIRRHIKKKMCLRSYRGKFIQHELQIKKSKKRKIVRSVGNNDSESSDFSSDDDEPLLKTVKKIVKPNKVALPKISKKCGITSKKPEIKNYRITRASNSRFSSNIEQTVKRKIQISKSTIITKSPFVKLTPPKRQTETLTSPIQKSKKIIKLKKGDLKSVKTKVVEKGLRKIGERRKLRNSSPLVKKENFLQTSSSPEQKKKCNQVESTSKKIVQSDTNKTTLIKKKSLEKLETSEKVVKQKPNVQAVKNKKVEIDKTDMKVTIGNKTESIVDKQTKRKLSETEQCAKAKLNKSSSSNVDETVKQEKTNSHLVKSTSTSPAEKNKKMKIEASPEKEVKKKCVKSEQLSSEEPKISQRPTRKTKEAAAIYMEILGHKLVHDGDIDDDDVSIDSFPELPNVRKTEQREIELKARVNPSTNVNKQVPFKKKIVSKNNSKDIKKPADSDKTSIIKEIKTDMEKSLSTKQDTSKLECNDQISSKNQINVDKRKTRGSVSKNMSSDLDELVIVDASDLVKEKEQKEEILVLSEKINKAQQEKSKEIEVNKVEDSNKEEMKILTSANKKAGATKTKPNIPLKKDEVSESEDSKKEEMKILTSANKKASATKTKPNKPLQKDEASESEGSNKEEMKIVTSVNKRPSATKTKPNKPLQKDEASESEGSNKEEMKILTSANKKASATKTKPNKPLQKDEASESEGSNKDEMKIVTSVNKKASATKTKPNKPLQKDEASESEGSNKEEMKILTSANKKASATKTKPNKPLQKDEASESEGSNKDEMKIVTSVNKKASATKTKPNKPLQKDEASESEGSNKEEMKIVTSVNKKASATKTKPLKKEELSESEDSSKSNSNKPLKCFNINDKAIPAVKTNTKLPEKEDLNKSITKSPKIATLISKKITVEETKKKPRKLEVLSDSEESVTSNKKLAKCYNKTRKITKASKPIVDSSFSDSDEEPLSKLAVSKIKTVDKEEDETLTKQETKKSKSESVSKDVKKPSKTKTKKEVDENNVNTPSPNLTLSGKPKRECTKRPQNYLPIFSSSEDEERYFSGFFKSDNIKQNQKTKIQTKCAPTTPSADLLCKDVDKRFGKGKVNMSTEQIEKWLNDSAIAENDVKSEGIDEKSNLPDPKEDNCLKQVNIKEEEKQFLEHVPVRSNAENPIEISPLKQTERKTIFRKERKTSMPSVNAFSPNNESSVYAFEADTEDTVKTPFRRPVTRRPSSTGTSRSEDSFKYEEAKIKKLSTPSPIKQEISKNRKKQEVSLTLSTDESNNSASIAVHLDLESPNSTRGATTKVDTENGEQLFYIPLQPGKQCSSKVIQGVAVKLGTKGPSGSNQQVVVSAKLVTHSPAGAQKLVEKPLPTSTPMYPPAAVMQKTKSHDNKGVKGGGGKTETFDDFKYKVPSSPSASSSSSTKVTKRQNLKTRLRSVEFCNPQNMSEFPTSQNSAALLEAPVFYPNDKEFQDPLEYIEKIRSYAEKFGICRIVPPSTFKPECKVSDDMRFTAYNQYVNKMLHRWGPNFKELMAITKYLKTQNITLTQPPWIGGMEIDLPRLYQIVQSLGGLKEVIEKKKWPKVSELMKIPKSAQDRVTKLDDIYCKYLLPYDTLSPAEREKLFDEVETDWAKRESRSLLKSQKKITSLDSSPNNSDSESDEESEECIVKGRNMALNAFYRIARNTMTMWFKTMEPEPQEVEQEFWKHVTVKQNHICVHSGSIDSGNWGYGFAVSKNSPFARHAWNLKVLTNNSGSILRSMGPVMGVTVPTLHVGMVFSACCWYRDPHSLPWIEYLHTGANKIWYGIPNSMSDMFHKALMKLVPNYCRNKSLWLPSDTAMVPPSLLVENGVSLCRTIQQPGQFIVVFPKAFTSSVCTGYVVSESVYFAPLSWLTTAQSMFKDLNDSCEPSMFSLEKLVINVATDARSNPEVLKKIIPIIELFSETEKTAWASLEKLGLRSKEKLPLPDTPIKKKKKFQNDSGDFECEVCCKNLFISWVTESEDVIYCLDHACKYIESKKMEIENCKIMYTYDCEDLKNLIDKIKNVIEMKLQKKTAGRIVAIA